MKSVKLITTYFAPMKPEEIKINKLKENMAHRLRQERLAKQRDDISRTSSAVIDLIDESDDLENIGQSHRTDLHSCWVY